MDGKAISISHHEMKPWLKPYCLLVFTANHHSRVSSRWCEMGFVHPQYFPFEHFTTLINAQSLHRTLALTIVIAPRKTPIPCAQRSLKLKKTPGKLALSGSQIPGMSWK